MVVLAAAAFGGSGLPFFIFYFPPERGRLAFWVGCLCWPTSGPLQNEGKSNRGVLVNVGPAESVFHRPPLRSGPR
jgi:hypothetical protein